MSKFRGISREQVCILFAADRKSDVVAQITGYGCISSTEIEGVIGDYLKDATCCFCTDAGKSFIAQEKGIEHHVLNANKGERVKGIYHIQHINAFHSRFRKWNAKFQGIATKYINHYLEWFRYIELHKRASTRNKKQDMLIRAFVNSRHVVTNSLKPCYASH